MICLFRYVKYASTRERIITAPMNTATRSRYGFNVPRMRWIVWPLNWVLNSSSSKLYIGYFPFQFDFNTRLQIEDLSVNTTDLFYQFFMCAHLHDMSLIHDQDKISDHDTL